MSQIDVILPTYNHDYFLRRAVDHILDQDFTDFTFIIVNDGSRDSTRQILEEYEKTDNRIRVFHNERNRGLPYTLNVGHSNGSSPYCTWVSTDNVSCKRFLSRLYDGITEDDYDFVQGKYVVIDNGLHKVQDVRTIHDNWGYGTIGATFLYKRNVWETYHYDEDLPYVEDLKFYLEARLHPFKFGFVDDCLIEYHIHPNSMTTKVHTDLEAHRVRMQKLYEKTIQPRIGRREI